MLFIPGFLLTLIFFKKSDVLERIALSIGFSICFSVLLGIILGYSSKIGISEFNLWLGYLLFCTCLLLVYYKNGKK